MEHLRLVRCPKFCPQHERIITPINITYKICIAAYLASRKYASKRTPAVVDGFKGCCRLSAHMNTQTHTYIHTFNSMHMTGTRSHHREHCPNGMLLATFVDIDGVSKVRAMIGCGEWCCTNVAFPTPSSSSAALPSVSDRRAIEHEWHHSLADVDFDVDVDISLILVV